MMKVNSEIKEAQVVLVNSENPNKVMSLAEAQDVADELKLDLVEVGVREDGIGVCKTMDYSKYVYKMHKNKAKDKKVELKEVRLTWKISDHDLEVKLNTIRRIILKDKDKVKVTIKFKGREVKMQSDGFELLDKIRAKLKGDGITSTPSKAAGANVYATFEKR